VLREREFGTIKLLAQCENSVFIGDYKQKSEVTSAHGKIINFFQNGDEFMLLF